MGYKSVNHPWKCQKYFSNKKIIILTNIKASNFLVCHSILLRSEMKWLVVFYQVSVSRVVIAKLTDVQPKCFIVILFLGTLVFKQKMVISVCGSVKQQSLWFGGKNIVLKCICYFDHLHVLNLLDHSCCQSNMKMMSVSVPLNERMLHLSEYLHHV